MVVGPAGGYSLSFVIPSLFEAIIQNDLKGFKMKNDSKRSKIIQQTDLYKRA